MTDPATRPGWERHDACSGTGEVCSKFCDPRGSTNDDHPHHSPCPDCVSGEVPSDGLVEAAAKAAFGVIRLPSSAEWADIWEVDGRLLAPQWRAALIAARRYEEGQ